ncbi:MAG: hypothetical protein AAFY71_25470 [Bacteroidota bacterium]
MNKFLILSLAVLFSLTSCVVEQQIMPEDDLTGIAYDTSSLSTTAPWDESKCAIEARFVLDESSSCGYYVEFADSDIKLVAKNPDIIEGKFKDGIKLMVGIDQSTFEERYCDEYAGADVICLNYLLDVPYEEAQINQVEFSK